MRKRAAMLAVCAGLLAAGTGEAARADSNDNLADPPVVCGSTPLSAGDGSRTCVADQQVRQRIEKHDAESHDVIDFADVITPLDSLVG